MLCDIGIIQRVVDVVAEAGAAVGQCDVEVDLQGLWHDLFTFVDADQRGDLEFAQEDDVHGFVEWWSRGVSRKIRAHSF